MTIKIKILCIAIFAMCGFLANLSINFLLVNNNRTQILYIEDNLLPRSRIIDENINAIVKIKEAFNSAISIGEFSIATEADAYSEKTLNNLDILSSLKGVNKESVLTLRESFIDYYDTSLQTTKVMVDGVAFTDEVKASLRRMKTSLTEYESLLDTLKLESNDSFKLSLDDVLKESSDVFQLSLIVFSVSLLVLGVISYFISASISKNVGQVSDALEVYATGNGDLTKRLPLVNNDEVGRLVANFNKFLDRLQIIISEVKKGAIDLEDATGKVLHAVSEQSVLRSSQQGQITQISLSISEMKEGVESIAKNAGLASDNVHQTEVQVKNGNEMVLETVHAIDSLSGDVSSAADSVGAVKESVSLIGSILDAISGISEQTNLLALNAAIEAARAGEQGRGFAVVADEVRSLAGSTQQSTLEIRKMIETLQSSTEQAFTTMSSGRQRAGGAVEIARRAGGALDKINKAITNIRDVNLLVASASTQQAVVTQSIHENIKSIEELGLGLSAQSEETQLLGGRLSELSGALSQLVGKFNT